MQRKSLAIWMCDDNVHIAKQSEIEDFILDDANTETAADNDTQSTVPNTSGNESEESKSVEYIWAGDRGLFPAPYPPEMEINKVQEIFFLVGALFGKVLQDGRKIDLPISEHVLRLLVSSEVPRDAKINMDNVEKWLMSAIEGKDKIELLKDAVSEHVLKFMQQLQQLVDTKTEIMSREDLSETEKKKLINELMLMHGDVQIPLEDLQYVWFFMSLWKCECFTSRNFFKFFEFV